MSQLLVFLSTLVKGGRSEMQERTEMANGCVWYTTELYSNKTVSKHFRWTIKKNSNRLQKLGNSIQLEPVCSLTMPFSLDRALAFLGRHYYMRSVHHLLVPHEQSNWRITIMFGTSTGKSNCPIKASLCHAGRVVWKCDPPAIGSSRVNTTEFYSHDVHTIRHCIAKRRYW